MPNKGDVIGYTNSGVPLYSTGVEGQGSATNLNVAPGITNTTSQSGVTDGSSSIRKEITTFQNTSDKMNQLLSDNTFIDQALGAKTYSQTDEGAKELQALRDSMKNSGILNDQELAQVEAAGTAEGAKYDPMIREAEESKRQGLPKAEIAAGERGGFMNSQFSGVSVILPTQGGNWRGAGGELERVAGVYDNNIANLKSQKLQAIEAAKVARQQAIMTGKRDMADKALQLYNVAKAANDEAIALANEKINVLNNYQKVQEARMNFTKQKEESILQRLDTSAQAGQMNIDPEDQKQLDAIYGQGFTQKYYATIQKAKTAQDDQQKAEAANEILDIMLKLPVGTKRTINGVTYEGLATSDPDTQTFSEEDAQGNVTYVTIDKTTGEILKSASGGKIGAGKKASGSGNSDGNSDGTTPNPPKSFEEWLKEKEAVDKMNYNVTDKKVKTRLQGEYEAYKKTLAPTSPVKKYTNEQMLKLQAAGLLNAPVEDQLAHLYPKKETEDEKMAAKLELLAKSWAGTK